MIQTNSKSCFLLAMIACSWLATSAAWAQEQETTTPQTTESEAPETSEPSIQLEVETEQDENVDDNNVESEDHDRPIAHHNTVVRFGSNAYLAADSAADAVISIFGSSTSEGEVREAVVSLFGDNKVTGPAGDVVSVFGDTYINSRVHGSAVAAFGNVELGPNAEISGEVVAVGGMLKRHADAVVYGEIEEVSFGGDFVQLRWMRPWVEECLLLGRPLAPISGIEWAWWLAGGFLALYMLIALVFQRAVDTCVRTLEDHPGESTLTALVSVFMVPVVFILLCVTVIGIVLVPFFGLALFLAGLFGKATVLAVIGRRITGGFESGPLAHLSFAVLVGGLIVTAMYMVPVLGFIVFNLLGILGFGVIVYTFMLASRIRNRQPAIAGAAAATHEATVTTESFSEPVSTSETTTGARATTTPGVAVPLSTLPRADFWVRMGALLIDVVLVGIIANMIPGSGDIWLLALATYGALMWKLKGTTVGGIIFNLRVVRLDGRDVDWATAIVRALGCFLSMAVVLLGFIWIIFDPERQAWHDKIAGTVVVRVPPGSLV